MASQNGDPVTQQGEVHDLPLDSLRTSRSPRLEGHSPDHVRVLAQAQEPLPPILVHRQSMRIIDQAPRRPDDPLAVLRR